MQVDELFLHYAATHVLKLDVYQSWGIEFARTASCDVQLRELLQGKQGKVSKYAQLLSVPQPAAAGEAPAPARVVGTIAFEMRRVT